MPKLSANRRITLSASQCREVGLEPGDDYQTFVADGCIIIVGQRPGSAWGCLSHIEGDNTVSEQQSRQDAIEQRRKHVDS